MGEKIAFMFGKWCFGNVKKIFEANYPINGQSKLISRWNSFFYFLSATANQLPIFIWILKSITNMQLHLSTYYTAKKKSIRSNTNTPYVS